MKNLPDKDRKIKVYAYRCAPLQHICLRKRWYRLTKKAILIIWTDWGVFHLEIDAGFEWDSRSGGPLADLFLPHMGTHNDQLCWFGHDIFGHDIGLSFKTTNEILRQMLVLAPRSRFKARLAKRTVSVSDDWFGCDTTAERLNKRKIHHSWLPPVRKAHALLQAKQWDNESWKRETA